jgi:hypothetical protein
MHFVVLSYPRTGSTVIQRLINADSNSMCVGEKPMVINHLYDFYTSIEDAMLVIPSLFPEIPLDDDKNPVYRADHVDMGLLKHMLREVFEEVVLARGNVPNIGWKENFISPFADGDIADKQIKFIHDLFPGIRFILNLRDPVETAKSPIWRVRDSAVEEIQIRRQWMVDRYEAGFFGNDALLLNYDEWSQDGNVIIAALQSFGFSINNNDAQRILGERLTHLSNI